MAVCGSCGMRMDGGAVLACKTAMKPLRRRGPRDHGRADGQPAGDQGPGRRHGAVLGARCARSSRTCDDHGEHAGEKEWLVAAGAAGAIRKESLCIMCGCCVSECNSMEADPDFLGPAALAKALPLRRRRARPRRRASALARPQRRARHLGLHALLLLQPALPEGRRPARRDREARRRVVRRRASRATRARSTPRCSSTRPTAAATCARRSSCRRPSARSPPSSTCRTRCASRAPARCRTRCSRTRRKDNDEVKRLWKLLERAGARARPRDRAVRAIDAPRED